MLRLTLFAAIIAPGIALAAGGGSTNPPTPSPTTTTCTGGKVWDSRTGSCKNPQRSDLDDETLYGAVREFAYAGQQNHAQAALAAMSDQTEDRVLTYWGFTSRKKGDVARGMEYYRQALEVNPANILARSYMGQALVEAGDIAGAREQLDEIVRYDGQGTWAEASLRKAIRLGHGYSY